jgi:hypothetical protein
VRVRVSPSAPKKKDNMKICPKCDATHNKNGMYCSRSCANSRTWTEEDKKKKSESVKKNFSENGHPSSGKPGWKHSDEMKELKRQKTLQHWDNIGRRTPEQKAAQNSLNVHNYRARKNKATCPTADMKLIKLIMENCPEGYEVDHIVSMSKGGKHHEDNLQYLPAMENRRKSNKDKYDESLAIRWQDVLKE